MDYKMLSKIVDASKGGVKLTSEDKKNIKSLFTRAESSYIRLSNDMILRLQLRGSGFIVTATKDSDGESHTLIISEDPIDDLDTNSLVKDTVSDIQNNNYID